MKKHIKIISVFLCFIMILSPCALTALGVSESDMKSKVISIAQNEVGYEGTGSYSKYGEWYGYQGAWCTTFVLWCFNKAGESLGVKLYTKIVPSGGNCNSMISWYKNKGRYHTRTSGYSPQKGDLVFFDWSGNGSSQHVGIVKSVSGSTIYTIEGNCSGKVKAKTYTTTGSKPYGNVSSIMGYGNPDWASVSGGSSSTTKKTTAKTTTKKKTTTTTKKQTTTKKKTTTTARQTTKKAATTKKQTTTAKPTTTTTTTTTTTATTTTTTTKPVITATDMKLYAATYDLQIGDSVKLDYSVEPNNAQAVIGYFCDEEGIIDISQGGVITATGEGVATVVVCANDEIYRQCDFTVSSVSSKVTKHTPDSVEEEIAPPSGLAEKSFEQKLSAVGINLERLKAHITYYIIPAYILGITAALSLAIIAVKAIAKAIRKKKEEKNSTSE